MSGPHILLTADAVGGVWSYASDLAGGLVREGFRVTVACLGPSPSAGQAEALGRQGASLVDTGLPLDWTARDGAELSAAGAALRALVADAGADLLHLNSPALAMGGRFGVPVVGGCHSCLGSWWQAVHPDSPLPGDFRWRMERLRGGLAACDVLLAPSRDFARRTARLHGLTPAVLYNGRRPAGSADLPMDRRAATALTAGRLWDRGKGLVALDAAAARMRHPVEAAGPLTGPGGEAVALSHVRALGLLSPDALAARMATARLFVSFAAYEPFGLAVLEAAQAGMALVLADTAVFRELWGGAALFLDPADATGASQAMEALLADPEACARLGAAARERSRRYSVEAMVAGTAALYRQLLAAATQRAVA